MERYFLTTDNDSHWFVVPVSKKAEWDEWLEIDPDDSLSWTAPAFAFEVGGSPGQITFTNWSRS